MILLILAAGMGSRYGGPKQIDTLINEKTILHFSLENSIPFYEKYIFVIRKDIKKKFKLLFKDFLREHKCEIVIQPTGFENNVPRGTAYPIICASKLLDDTFTVINADDYYGKRSFESLNSYFSNFEVKTCMIGYILGNTLSHNGPVNRGICYVDDENFLIDIKETKGITVENCEKDKKVIVSMNFFTFEKQDLIHFQNEYELYMKTYMNQEFMLPNVVNTIIKNKNIKVIQTHDKWIGLTFKEDKQHVIDFLRNYHMC